jgi:MoxR-like ATPase
VQLDPVDLRGLPRISADQAEWVPPKFLPTSGQGILFLDELTAAPQMTQAGCYQLVLDRKLGEYRLPEGWVVIAAGNPASERGVHFSMPRPLRNRFVHLDLEPDFEDWSKWAMRAGIRPEILAFLRFKPALLHDADATSDQNAWPTPRSWEMASQVLTGVAKRQEALDLQRGRRLKPPCSRAQSAKRRPLSLWPSCGYSGSCLRCRRSCSTQIKLPFPKSRRRGSPWLPLWAES